MNVRLTPRVLDLLVQSHQSIKIKGWATFELVGWDGKVQHRHTQDNLLLNRGKDYILSNLDIRSLTQYVAVGTSNTTPTAGDSGLGAEIARTSATLGAGSDETLTELGDGQYRITRVRTFDYGQANGNLTEFGGSESSSAGGGTRTRELFKSGAVPITITKTSNERLVITYNTDITFSPTAESDEADINFLDNASSVVATRKTSEIWRRAALGGQMIYYGDFQLLYNNQAKISLVYYTSAPNMTYGGGNAGTVITTTPFLTYSNGNYYRDVEAEIGPTGSNINVYAYGLASKWSAFGGNAEVGVYMTRFRTSGGADDPFLKNKDYRLKLRQRISIS